MAGQKDNPLPIPVRFKWLRRTIPVTAFIFVVLLTVIAVEFFVSAALMHYYRWTGAITDGSHQSSALNVIDTLLSRFALPSVAQNGVYEYRKTSVPSNFQKADDILGYVAVPGTFKHIYQRRKNGSREWESIQLNVTINNDGSRWTGKNDYYADNPHIFIFGDSFAFGAGVNDEQTFSYLLQAAMPEKNVHLFALGGYSLVQTYLKFRELSNRITSEDIIIICYADFYDVRNVAAPSRIKEVEQWFKANNLDPRGAPRIPKVSVGADGTVVFELVDQICGASNCNIADPSQKSMTAVSARLINDIAGSTLARIYVLHYGGSKENRLFNLLDKRVELISALPRDFDYFIQDNVEGFDPHPGPYWHYAVSRILVDRIK